MPHKLSEVIDNNPQVDYSYKFEVGEKKKNNNIRASHKKKQSQLSCDCFFLFNNIYKINAVPKYVLLFHIHLQQHVLCTYPIQSHSY